MNGLIQLSMPRAHCVIADGVPHVMSRTDGLGPGLREIAPRSGGLCPGNANRSGFRNASQLVFDALSDIGVALAVRYPASGPFLSLLGGLHGQRADQCYLLLAQAIENRPGGCVFELAASFPADLLANPEPRVVVGRGRAAQHDVGHRAGPFVEPH